MTEADFSGEYLNEENCEDGDIITIIGEPTTERKMSMANKPYTATNIPVNIEGKAKTFTPDKETGKAFIAAWGKEMLNWVGKKAAIKIIEKQIYGKQKKVVQAVPIKA